MKNICNLQNVRQLICIGISFFHNLFISSKNRLRRSSSYLHAKVWDFPCTRSVRGDPIMEKFKIKTCPDTVFYVPNFITEKEEKYLIDEVYKAPKTKWVVLSNRRLQNWGGLPQPKGMVQELIPKWLKECCDKIVNLGLFQGHAPNHVLVNEYKPGQGIMPHEDGPLYHPIVTTISLGSHTRLEFYPRCENHSREGSAFSLLLEPRSLLVLKDDMYLNHLHGISERTTDILQQTDVCNVESLGDESLKQKLLNEDEVRLGRTTRVSLTIRHVPKTIKLKLQFGKLRS